MASKPPENCYGKSWKREHIPCNGGLDAAYINPKTGSNQREPCAWVKPCSARVTAAQAQRQQLITKEQMVRNAQPQQQAAFAQPTTPWAPVKQAAVAVMNRLAQAPRYPAPLPAAPAQQQVPVHPQQVYQQSVAMPQQMVHPTMAMMPHAVPMSFQWPGAQMPGYLTVPEPVVAGQHWFVRLGFNVLRSMGKAGTHTAANFFDHNTINTFQPPAK